jgi:nucleotide-binding universal stress UspA family protein
MIRFQRILIDIDPTAPAHPALEQGLDLAARAGGRVHLVDVLPDVPARARGYVTSAVEEELATYRGERLAEIAANAGTTVPIETALLRGHPALALVQDVLARGHDLLIRSHVRTLAAEDQPFGPIDQQLLRKCPCPVWLIGPKGRRPRKILAAVHSNPDDKEEQALNAKILDLAQRIAELEEGNVTILEAWTAYGEELLKPRFTPEEYESFLEETRKAALDDVRALAAEGGQRFAGAKLEVVKGLPEDVIPGYAREHGFDLVVMGTVARTGIAGLVMGNTAERVLQRLGGSVLAVKPDGWVCPVSPAAGAAPPRSDRAPRSPARPRKGGSASAARGKSRR